MEGCAVDTSPLPPWGRAVTAPGATTCAVRVSWPASVQYPAVLDPAWSSTGSMAVHRRDFVLERLSNGRVLAAGGLSDSSVTGSAELYDESTGTWSTTGSMPAGRKEHRGVRLKDGRVLVAGGMNVDGAAVATTYLYNPLTGTWSTTGALATTRREHALTVLPSGKVLAVGGRNAAGTVLSSAERFDPATGTWSAAASLSGPRTRHALASISADRPWISGGNDGTTTSNVLEGYDEPTNSWAVVYMPTPREGHTMTRTSEAKLLLVGGSDGSGLLASTAAFDMSTGWATGPAISAAVSGHTVATMLDGQALIVGGDAGSAKVATVQSYDPTTSTLATLPGLTTARARHASVVLPSGNVLVAGGQMATGVSGSAEVLTITPSGAGAGSPQPSLLMAWTTASGTQSSSSNVALSVTNARGYAVRYKLTLRGVGLDGREVSIDKGTFTLAANAATTHAVPASQLPVQSKGTDSRAEWIADILGDGCPLGDAGADATATSDAGENCEPSGAIALSMPLYHTFSSDYSTVTIRGLRAQTYGSDTNLQTTTAVLAQTLPNGPPALDGRVYDGTGYTSYASLSPLGTADYTWKNMHTLSPAAAQRLSELGVDQPGAPSGPALCPRWETGEFLDDGKGELVTLGTSVPAARAQAIVVRANPDLSYTPVWQGFLDDDGCTKPLALVAGATYRVTLLTRAVVTSDAGDFGVTVGTKTTEPLVHGYDRFITVHNVALAGVPVPFRFAEPEARVAAIVSAMMAQGGYVGTRLGVEYPIYADQRCATTATCTLGGTIYIGPHLYWLQTHSAQWKVVVTHEIGHAVQDVTIGTPNDGNYDDDVYAPPFCRCEHVNLPSDRQSCLQSRETTGTAQVEAYGHFFASRVWSGASSTECTLPYYKQVYDEVLLTSGPVPRLVPMVHSPPYAADCATPLRWLENHCSMQNIITPDAYRRGAEWDWLNFFHHVHSSDVDGSLSHGEMFEVYRRACGNKRCTGPKNPAELKAVVNIVFGPNSRKARNFLQSFDTYGVDN